jgi:hypothetical protein
MKAIYLAGPYSAPSDDLRACNIQAAWQRAAFLWSIPGVYCVCPHLNTMNMDGVVTLDGATDREKFIQADLDLLARCDAIYMLRNWEGSKGAAGEHTYAVNLKKRIFYEGKDWSTAIRNWAEAEDRAKWELKSG